MVVLLVVVVVAQAGIEQVRLRFQEVQVMAFLLAVAVLVFLHRVLVQMVVIAALAA